MLLVSFAVDHALRLDVSLMIHCLLVEDVAEFAADKEGDEERNEGEKD